MSLIDGPSPPALYVTIVTVYVTPPESPMIVCEDSSLSIVIGRVIMAEGGGEGSK